VTVVLPTTALLLLALSGAPDPDGLARDVLALSASGDPARMDRASAVVPESLRADPAYRSAAAGRLLARFLAAADLRETSAASPEGAPGLRRARATQEEALEELRPLVQQAPDDPDVLRVLLVYYGLDGRPEEVARLSARLREGGTPKDPWIDFAEMAAAARGKTAADAEPLLTAFVTAHPEIRPPRMSLARARLARGDRDGAIAVLDDLLGVDPDHEAAKELKASLLAPPPVERLTPVAPAGVPPPTAPGYLPRKKVTRTSRAPG
jgi:tetratricopeptide (TPR) repeat protein